MFTSNNLEKILITLAPKKADGSSGSIDGAPVVRIISGDITSEPNPEDTSNLSFWLLSGSAVAQSNFEVDVDADLGAGVRKITLADVYDVTDAGVTSVGMSAGAPVLKNVAAAESSAARNTSRRS